MKDKINKLIKECVAPDIQDRYSFETISKGYSAKLYSNVLVNIDISMKAKNRITFKGNENLINLIPSSFKTLIKYEETEKKSIPIYIIDTEKSEDSLLKALRNLKGAFEEQQEWIFNQHPAETPFGCCGHYEECSDKGFCIQYSIDRPFYKGCEYKKNLEAGKIFYGKNKI